MAKKKLTTRVEESKEATKDNMPKPKEIFDHQQTVCDNFHKWIQTEMSRYDPVMVHMTVLGQTLKIMKSVMPAKDYDSMMETVYHKKDDIEPFTKRLLH